MSRKVMVYIATSLDGYIATDKDSLEWLFKVEGEGDNGYSEFYDTIDTVVLGRRTYDWIRNFEEENFPYANKKCYVFTRTPYVADENVEFIHGDISKFISSLKMEAGKNIWIVGGGEIISQCVKEKLVDEFILFVAPTLIGKGISLFNQQNIEVELELKSVRQFKQFAQLHYVKK
mgnify:CR=1 FL=1